MSSLCRLEVDALNLSHKHPHYDFFTTIMRVPLAKVTKRGLQELQTTPSPPLAHIQYFEMLGEGWGEVDCHGGSSLNTTYISFSSLSALLQFLSIEFLNGLFKNFQSVRVKFLPCVSKLLHPPSPLPYETLSLRLVTHSSHANLLCTDTPHGRKGWAGCFCSHFQTTDIV